MVRNIDSRTTLTLDSDQTGLLMPRRPTSVPMRLRHSGDEVSIAIEDDLSEPALLRQMIRGVLPDDMPARVRDDLLLVVSELITNALIHGASPRRLHLMLLDQGVHIEVDDASEVPAIPVDPTDRVGGLGLHIVQGLCSAWGSEPHGPGKRVWCDLAMDAPHPGG